MNHLAKKRILISAEQKNAQVGSFFRELGLELCTEFSKDHLGDYLLIVDDYMEELKILPRIQTKKTIASTCSAEVRGFFDENLINEGGAKDLLSSYFSDAQDFDLVDRFSRDFQNIFTLKIHDYLNVGYFIDTIVVEAYKGKFDYEQIRTYLNFALPYSLKLIEQEERHTPLEVSFSHDDKGFAVQISLSAPSLDMSKDFNSKSEKLTTFSTNANYFDASYFKKRERLLLSSLWFKEKNLQSFKSFFFTEIVERQNLGEKNSALINRLDENQENIQYEANLNSVDQPNKLHLARKFSLFIKNFRTKEESPAEVASLSIEDIDNYLSHYPRPGALLAVDLEIKNFIIKLLNDDTLYNGVAEYIQKMANSNLDSHLDEIQRILGKKSLEDISEIIRLKAGPKDDSSDVMKVSGWTEATDEGWKVKRTGLIEQIKEQVIAIQSSGRNVVEEDIVQIVSEQLNADPDEVRIVVKELVEEAVSGGLVKKEKLEEAFALRFISQQPGEAEAREKLEGQIVRMKKIMEQMRDEIIKLRAEADVSKQEEKNPTIDEMQSTELLSLKKTLTKALDMMRAKEKVFQKQKSDFEKILEAKENKIQTLEANLEQSKGEFSRSREFANEEKLELLQNENKSLANRLEFANQKIIIISGNMNKQDSDSSLKKDNELVTLKTNIQMAQALIEKFKHERADLESKLIEEKEKYIRLRDEKGGTGIVKEQTESNLTLVSIQAEKKALEEKHRALGMEFKKLDQKHKFTVAQLDESRKRKAHPNAAVSKSNETYVKQLEVANARINETTNDIAEKKKEAIKLKLENTLLASKVSELEKKLAISDKKAA